MNIQEIIPRIDYQMPIVYRMDFDNLTTATPNSVTQMLTIGGQSVFVDRMMACGTDAAGLVLFDGDFNPQDWIYASMKNSDSMNYFDNPITLTMFNKIGLSPSFRGWLFRSKLEISMDISVAAIPVAPVLTDPVKIMIFFSGYKLSN